MPVKIPRTLPASSTLTEENIFVITEERAAAQEIRPLRVAILNLMPTKIATETQLLRLLGNSALQVEITLLQTATYQARHTDAAHLLMHYVSFEDVREQRFDGLIITGAPVEHLGFEEVDYWRELCGIMDWAETHVTGCMYICWGAQAAMYHKFGVPKHGLTRKMFGVFEHRVLEPQWGIFKGFDDRFFAPHSRHTETRRADIERVGELVLLSESDEAGVHMVGTRDGRHLFITGHSEYDPMTLKAEYDRDVAKGLPIHVPCNYYPDDDPGLLPMVRWRAHANVLFSNWLNYHVYQIASLRS